MSFLSEDQARVARERLLADLKKLYPCGQIPAKELYQPDPVARSMQGPMEITHATFDNCQIKMGKRHA
jgi:hypothetical protein